ncbi:MAG TPA: hypothetical protein PKX48_10675 [Planctomycetota bacterium]|nr:hypothetical protein [Planctomycetota bacterium]OQC21058.1 MAG: hypothetical protein BWX69_01254 [Planctomycetes bacterium ADurb.Bin069]HNR99448.1 hypothetical protein [Planctomycetota bacterium]HNU25988.1 hypothetical protein [Planctomycetota bacterium]HOE30353.1 hypothetical protein [Planctomycetota bacterium]
MRARTACHFFVLAAVCVPITGCALFNSAEFYLGGSRVAVMPFRGTEGKWYGEDKVANSIYQRACAVLAQGGARICQSEKIMNEVVAYDGRLDPPWVTYGEQLGADYVIVARLMMWEVGRATAIGYVPGRAMLNVDVYSVADKDVTFSRVIDVSIGSGESMDDMVSGVEAGKEMLIRLILKRWQEVFIKKAW